MTAMNKLTTTYETTREFDEKGNVTHEIHTETREEPDCASYIVTTSTTSDEDIAEMLDGLIELQEPTPSGHHYRCCRYCIHHRFCLSDCKDNQAQIRRAYD